MNFSVRPATVADAADIARIQVETWKSTYKGIVSATLLDSLNVATQTERWQTQFDPAVTILVAINQAGAFGFASGGKLREPVDDYDGELYAIYILPQHQLQGAGRTLSHAVASALLGQGFKSMLVWVLEANPAVSFYQRLGALPVSTRLIELGGAQLPEVALGWPTLSTFR